MTKEEFITGQKKIIELKDKMFGDGDDRKECTDIFNEIMNDRAAMTVFMSLILSAVGSAEDVFAEWEKHYDEPDFEDFLKQMEEITDAWIENKGVFHTQEYLASFDEA